MDKKFLKWYRLFTGVIHGDKLKNHDWVVWQAALASQQRETIDISELAMEGRKMKKVIDVDGNKYKTVKIGKQVWMAENLKVTHYRNGDPISNITINRNWEKLKTGAYCNYNNDESYVPVYGRLYNWYAVNDVRGLAPEGWHVPTDEEWRTLVDYLGGNLIAGDKLKETGTERWSSPNTGATNESGFSGLPGGYRYYDGTFYYLGSYAYFWSASSYLGGYAWSRRLVYDCSDVRRYYSGMRGGFSVRCVRD